MYRPRNRRRAENKGRGRDALSRFSKGKNVEQQIKGGCVKNPQGVLRIAKKKDGHREVQATRRIQPILDVVKKAKINPLSVLSVAKKRSGAARAEKQKRAESNEAKLDYNGPKTIEEVKKSGQLAKPSKFDASNCLAVKGGGEE